MAFPVSRALVLIVAAAAASTLTASGSRLGLNNFGTFGNRIIVGGSEHWHFGFDYSEWAAEMSPFHINDVLVFKYDPPNATVFPHSVYLLPDLTSFLTCDLSKGKMIANTTEGGGEGFEYVLDKWQHQYYFACGEHDGIHCKDGKMRFLAIPTNNF